MKKAIKEVVGGFTSLVIGMKITIREFFKPSVTVHYPHQALTIPPRFRGHIELVRDSRPANPSALPASCASAHVQAIAFPSKVRSSMALKRNR
jgi:NADH-quinone oxidoreductase subunit I